MCASLYMPIVVLYYCTLQGPVLSDQKWFIICVCFLCKYLCLYFYVSMCGYKESDMTE